MNSSIDLNQRLNELLDTCRLSVLNNSEEEIEYTLLEDVNTEIFTCLANDSLRELLLSKFINQELLHKLEKLRQEYLVLENTSWGDGHFIKSNNAWKQWLIFCEEIRDCKKKFDDCV